MCIYSYKGRTLETDVKVSVYRNLNNGLLSIKQGGLVVAHADSISLESCEFVVNEAGRQRVLEEGRKNVHAYVRGFVTDGFVDRLELVKYNPYKMSTFTFADTEEPATFSRFVKIDKDGKIFARKGL